MKCHEHCWQKGVTEIEIALMIRRQTHKMTPNRSRRAWKFNGIEIGRAKIWRLVETYLCGSISRCKWCLRLLFLVCEAQHKVNSHRRMKFSISFFAFLRFENCRIRKTYICLLIQPNNSLHFVRCESIFLLRFFFFGCVSTTLELTRQKAKIELISISWAHVLRRTINGTKEKRPAVEDEEYDSRSSRTRSVAN